MRKKIISKESVINRIAELNKIAEFNKFDRYVVGASVIQSKYKKALYAFGIDPSEEDDEPAPMAMRYPPKYVDLPGQGLTPYQAFNPELPLSKQVIMFGEPVASTPMGASFVEKPVPIEVRYMEEDEEKSANTRHNIGKLYWVNNKLLQVVSYNDERDQYKLSDQFENQMFSSMELNSLNEFIDNTLVRIDPQGGNKANLFARVKNAYIPSTGRGRFAVRDISTGEKYHISSVFKSDSY